MHDQSVKRTSERRQNVYLGLHTNSSPGDVVFAPGRCRHQLIFYIAFVSSLCFGAEIVHKTFIKHNVVFSGKVARDHQNINSCSSKEKLSEGNKAMTRKDYKLCA